MFVTVIVSLPCYQNFYRTLFSSGISAYCHEIHWVILFAILPKQYLSYFSWHGPLRLSPKSKLFAQPVPIALPAHGKKLFLMLKPFGIELDGSSIASNSPRFWFLTSPKMGAMWALTHTNHGSRRSKMPLTVPQSPNPDASLGHPSISPVKSITQAHVIIIIARTKPFPQHWIQQAIQDYPRNSAKKLQNTSKNQKH